MRGTKPILESKYSTYFSSSLGMYLLFGVLCNTAAVFLLRDAILPQPPNYLGMVIGLTFGVFGTVLLYMAYTHDRFIVYEDRLVVKSFMGFTKKEIYLNQITGWSEIMKFTSFSTKGNLYKQIDPYTDSSVMRWFKFTVYTPATKYTLNSYLYENWPAIRKVLTHNKKNVVTPVNWFDRL